MAQTPYPHNSSQPYDQQGYGQPPQPYGQQQPYGQPGYPQPYGQQPYNPNAKSKTAAALLAFFLGGFGAHSFYRGQMKRGAGHLALMVLTVLLFIVGVVMAASHTDAYGQIAGSGTVQVGDAVIMANLVAGANSLWAFVEFIMILVSKDGSLR
ncbi:TM2 domain-containing protein [Actinomyces urogenitalis]|uniref:TM2 domain-containing protein n=1 Tax=Actinomyces urogenitalis TaxID=103621 RepID=UPI00069D6CCD|nr:TM2 domain-containing protein [Actinomyces urogenitalis]